jgi:ACT domain-containing protein
MMQLRKIPLGQFIEILQDLFETGADFIDISGESSDDGETPKDTIKITVRPEYLSDENDTIELEQEVSMDYSDLDDEQSSKLSDDDINDLI